MFRTINPSSLRLHLGVGLGVSSILIGQQLLSKPNRRVLYCQSAMTSSPSQSTSWFAQNKPAQQVQLEETEGAIFNPVAFRQISSGSFIGLLAGIAVGKISKILAFAALAVAFGFQYLESQGIHVIPYNKVQKLVGNVDAKKLIYENIAFKVAFGSSFILAVCYAR